MEYIKTILPETATILTTEEFLALEKKIDVRSFVDREISEGKASKLRGWVMSEILRKIQEQFGKAEVPIAKEYIVSEVCGIEKAHFDNGALSHPL